MKINFYRSQGGPEGQKVLNPIRSSSHKGASIPKVKKFRKGNTETTERGGS